MLYYTSDWLNDNHWPLLFNKKVSALLLLLFLNITLKMKSSFTTWKFKRLIFSRKNHTNHFAFMCLCVRSDCVRFSRFTFQIDSSLRCDRVALLLYFRIVYKIQIFHSSLFTDHHGDYYFHFAVKAKYRRNEIYVV